MRLDRLTVKSRDALATAESLALLEQKEGLVVDFESGGMLSIAPATEEAA